MEVFVRVHPDAAVDDELRERLSRQLRVEMAELDVESVTQLAGEAVPADAKAADPVTVGAIVVALGSSGGMFALLVETVRDWLARQQQPHRVSMTVDGDTIELDHASPEQARALVDAFVRRHGSA